MSGYAVGVFCVCLASGVASFIAYGREGGCRAALSVLILYSVAMPLLKGGEPSFRLPELSLPEYGTELEGDYIRVAEEALEQGLKKAVTAEFSLGEEEVTVAVKGFDPVTAEAEEVTVVLRGEGALRDPERVRKYVENIGFRRCRIEFEI